MSESNGLEMVGDTVTLGFKANGELAERRLVANIADLKADLEAVREECRITAEKSGKADVPHWDEVKMFQAVLKERHHVTLTLGETDGLADLVDVRYQQKKRLAIDAWRSAAKLSPSTASPTAT